MSYGIEMYNTVSSDREDELYQKAKKWFYDNCHGSPDEIISKLTDLLIEVDEETVKQLGIKRVTVVRTKSNRYYDN